MAFEWVAGLFQSDNQQTRGLSGDNAGSVALDDANPYYNYRLRRHKAEGDVIGDAGLLWYTSPYVKRRSGLGTHVGAEIGDGTANYSDVLMILSRDDFARADADWQASTMRVLQQEFENFCRRENFNRLHAHRQLGFRFLQDGSSEMGGQSLGLGQGEFVTGLLPNLYTGPVRGSYPVIGVHVNLPGVWDGYQEVGRLYNDQILFTLGSHWLDNFSHPSLDQAALYRLRQYPDGSFVHIINPDLQDQYQVTSTNQGGASVLTLATRVGQPLAYIVLAVIDAPSTRPSKPPSTEPSTGRGARPDIKLPAPAPKPARPSSTPSPASARRDVPSIAPPMLLEEPSSDGALGGKTIIPDAPSERIFTFQERGALLQKVHFSAFMLGYDVYLGSRGELGTHVEDPAATFQVRKRSVSLVSHVDGVKVGGRPVPAGVEVPIEGDLQIELAGQRLEYRDLRGMRVDGWPYVGEIRRPASSTYMIWSEDYQIGRSRECRVVLPDEPRNDNIHWKPSVGDGATIRARTGEIPKSRFYTDSIMVASEHATVDLREENPRLICTARHCYLYVRRANEVMPLYPATSGRQPQELEVQPGDEVLIGNQLFHLGFTPAGEAIAPAPAPKVELSPDSLANAVASPDLDSLDKGSEPPPPPRQAGPPDDAEPPGPPPVDDDEAPPPGPPPDEEPPPGPPPLESALPEPASDPLDAPTSRPPPPPVQPMGMDSIIGEADSTAGPLGTEGPIDISDEDEPTIPGLVLPSDAFDDDRPAFESSSAPAPEPTQSLPPLAEDPSDDVGGWDDDESWDDGASQESTPLGVEARTDGTAGEVPPPFPDVAEPTGELEATVAFHIPDLTDEAPLTEPIDAGALAAEDTYDAPSADEPPSSPESDASAEPDTGAESDASAESDAGAESDASAESDAAAEQPPSSEPDIDASDDGFGAVVVTDDHEAQFELGRPMHLIQAGWMINGRVRCGNHAGADLVLPENRIVPEQQFEARDYFHLKIRGRRGNLEVLTPSELLVDGDDPKQDQYDNPQELTLDVIRRDDAGEEDFAVRLTIAEDRALPDPRARFVAIDTDDPLAAALVTRGLPKGAPRALEFDGIKLNVLFDGETVTVSDYLETYRRGDGFHPFFVQAGGGRFVTAPEDGASFQVRSGDRIVVGTAVYVLREE